jgi:hypothetical protein
MAFGNVRRFYADQIYVKGPWTRGTTNTVAGGVFWHGSTTTSTLQMQYYGAGVAFVGAVGASNVITIDGITQTSSFGAWLGLSLATDFHTLTLACGGGTARLEAIDVQMPAGQITSYQNYNPLPVSHNPLVDNATIEYDYAMQLRIKRAGISINNMAANSVGTTNIVDGAVTYAKRASVNLVVATTTTGAYTRNANTYADVTNATVTITTTGKPVALFLMSDGTDQNVGINRTGAGTATGYLKYVRGSTDLASAVIQSDTGGNNTVNPCWQFYYIDQPAAGTYTYKVQAKVGTGGSDVITVNATKLVAMEL